MTGECGIFVASEKKKNLCSVCIVKPVVLWISDFSLKTMLSGLYGHDLDMGTLHAMDKYNAISADSWLAGVTVGKEQW